MKYHRFDKVDIQTRFWSKVDIRDRDVCWNWLASKDGRGYGMFSIGRRGGRKSPMMRSHRFALELKEGRRLQPHEESCHSCDNTSCCNPNHLFLGSHKDNMQDMISKNRGNHPIKITDHDMSDMIMLRGYGVPIKSISDLYGISSSQCSRLTRGMRV